ncbi:hypothetical protein DV26_01930 [Amycolatopsis mediterranei]|nr:hypothetical protein DV26_01930 [Amycolatopsis mediterranei]
MVLDGATDVVVRRRALRHPTQVWFPYHVTTCPHLESRRRLVGQLFGSHGRQPVFSVGVDSGTEFCYRMS